VATCQGLNVKKSPRNPLNSKENLESEKNFAGKVHARDPIPEKNGIFYDDYFFSLFLTQWHPKHTFIIHRTKKLGTQSFLGIYVKSFELNR